jgi:hypothetical protein
MAAPDQEFTIADVINVSPKVTLWDFSSCPYAGTLVVLQPPCRVSGKGLSGYFAEVSSLQGPVLRFDYDHWQTNSADVIGLMSKKAISSSISPGSKVRFVKRT